VILVLVHKVPFEVSTWSGPSLESQILKVGPFIISSSKSPFMKVMSKCSNTPFILRCNCNNCTKLWVTWQQARRFHQSANLFCCSNQATNLVFSFSTHVHLLVMGSFLGVDFVSSHALVLCIDSIFEHIATLQLGCWIVSQ